MMCVCVCSSVGVAEGRLGVGVGVYSEGWWRVGCISVRMGVCA